MNGIKKTAFTLMVLVLVISGCRQTIKEVVQDQRPIPVKTAVAGYRTFREKVHTAGKLASREEVKLSFKTGGIIAAIPVREGSQVKKGATLASLNLAEIQANARQARLASDKAYRDLSRAKNLYRDSVATLEQLQNARTAYELAKAQKEIADFNLHYSTIKAPADGKILKILVEVNEMIAPGYPVILFAPSSGDWVLKSSLTDKDVVSVSPGDSAVIKLDAFPDLCFTAEITEIAAMADPYTGTYETEIRISDPLPGFRTGLIASADIYPTGTDSLIWVPMNSLLEPVDNTGYVFVLVNGYPVRKRVITHSVFDNGILVKEGLSGGDSLITEGAAMINQESRIRIVQ